MTWRLPFTVPTHTRTPNEHLLRRFLTSPDELVGLLVRSASRGVAATDELEREHLAATARIPGYEDRDGVTASAWLFAEIERSLAESAALLDRLSRA